MEDQAREERHEYSLASRKTEEADLRRYQASHWLECLVGPLGISSQPSEKEFISCLRNGLVLCKLMNIIQPGSVPKVVVTQLSSNSQTWDSQHLPAAYQYFENVRNFLAAIEALKIPAFEASIFERDCVQEGSSSKVVDCILALKVYHEWQQMTGDENGIHKPLRSPFVVHLSGRINTQSSAMKPSDNFQPLDISASCNKQLQTACDNQKLQGLIVKALTERMLDTKENIDTDIIGSFQDGKMDAIEAFGRILSTCLEQGIQKYPELKTENNQSYKDRDSTGQIASCPPPNILNPVNKKSCRACLRNDGHCKCKHKNLVDLQEKELLNLKALLSSAKKDFEDLQAQLENDLKQIGIQVQEMSFAANKYYTVVEENRSLYNMVQDLKGNIRVYCRIRPVFNGAQTVIDFIGQDGSLVLIDPLKSRNEGRKGFQFNHVFGLTANQEEVFKETQPLIRSVMDGYNVCIFAYGQTGSGKTYTMCGPYGESITKLGINYLALNDLFQLSYERADIIKYEIYVQMVEIYNEQVHDLLTEDSSLSKLEIRSCSGENNFALPDASIHRVTSTTDVIRLMKFGEINRAVSSTTINERSSRSHSVLTIHVHGEDVSRSSSCNKLHSCLHLVDLAGSERVDKSGFTGEGLKEAQHINKSLSCLGDVIMALAQKNPHIPYRNSKLTQLLQNALGGHAKTLMLVHVSPEEESFGETMSTLKFAQRVSTVELGAAGVVYKESNEVLELKLQIESLKAALGSKETTSSATQRNKTTPIRKVKTLMEKTPPRARRLSIENCNNRKEERMNFESRKGSKTPPIPPRPRRLSMEGGGGGRSSSNKDSEQIKMLDKKPVKMEATSLQTPPKQLQDVEVKRCEIINVSSKSPLPMVPRSPRNSPFHDLVIEKPDVKPKMLQLHQIKTPEPTLKAYKKERTTKNEHDPPLMAATPEPTLKTYKKERTTKNEHDPPLMAASSSNTTTGLSNNSAPHVKGSSSSSQIKKSLRSIGKFINGSDKRNQQKLVETTTTTPVSRFPHEPKSPISSARTLRRQSLTGSVSTSSRRSSLGGVVDPKRNSKTPPPPMRASSINQSDKRWL